MLWHGFTQMACFEENEPVVVVSASDHELVDPDGRRYLDAISSLWVTTLGHRVPELDDALIAQLGRVAHATLLGNSNVAAIECAEALAAIVPVDAPHVLFASDGASAVEQALKIAFQYWVNRGVLGRTTFLALGDAYHGDTVGALSLGDGGFGTEIFDPLRFRCLRAPGYRDPEWLEGALAVLGRHAGEIAAVVLEPVVQGAAGMLVAEPADVGAFGRACRDAGVLLVADEVATGFGRTGAMFASELCGLTPDLLCLGKGLTGGYLPMSATVAAGHVYDAFRGEDLGPAALYHGHSYGGNALCAAVAKRHIELLAERDIVAGVAARGAYLGDLLEAAIEPLPCVAEVRRAGLMVGVELEPGEPGVHRGRWVCREAVRRGVLLRSLGDVVVVMPPLTISEDDMERIVGVLAEAITEVCGG